MKGIIATPDREIIVSPLAFHSPKVVNVPHGATIWDIVNLLYPDTYVIVEIDGMPIPRDQWHLVPPVDSHVLISFLMYGGGGGGGGGKNPLRTLLTVVTVVAAIAIPAAMPALYGFMGTSYATSLVLWQGAALTAGMFLVDAIAPIKYSSSGPGVTARQTYEDSPTYSIGASSNRENPWGVIPVILGTHKVFPPLGAKSYTELVGSDEYLRMLFVWGYGPMKISDLKLGDTLLSSYTDVEIETKEGWPTDTPLTLFPSAVQQDSIGVILTSAGGQIVRTAKANVDELSVDVSFSRGLVRFNDSGNREYQSVTVLVQYREVGTSTWTTVESKTFSDLTTSAVRYGWRWKVDNTKQYEIGITRTTPDTNNDQIIDNVYWTYLRSIETDYPITFPHPLAVTALRIKATDQLSGNIDNLNGIVSSYCPVWDSVAKTWGSATVTNNPAALIRHVLTGDANARARTSAQVDNDTLGEFYEFCATNGYAFNMYRDYVASVFETCQDIASAARGSITIKDGLWSVIADTGKQTLVQHITPRNSWGFSAEKRLYDHPHAFRIKFKNELNDWNDDERIVYDDGYDENNATLFESIEFPGITHPNLIWKFGRFHIAQARLRPEMYSLYMDFEHLVCRRGDKVRVSHDVPLWGSGWGRIKSLTIDGGNITHVTLDELVTMEAGKSYACRFRLADGGTSVLSIVTDAGETDVLELATPVAVALGPKAGDLAMFGEAEKETVELLVHSITRASDFTAQLFLVDVASDIYNADTGAIPPFNPQTTTPVDITTLAPDPPTILNTESGTDVSTTSGGGSVSSLIVYLSPPPNDVRIRGYRIRYRVTGESQWQYTPEMETLTITIPAVVEGVEYEIQAQSISVYGVPSTWTAVGTGTPATPQIIPSHPTGIQAQLVAGGVAYNYCAVNVTFTPPIDSVFSHCDVYASNDDLIYHYVGQNSTGSFTFSGLGSIYEADDTCYIKLRSVSNYGLSEAMPDVADTLVLIDAYIRLAGFYAGSQFFGDAANPNDAKILLDKANTLIRIGDLSAPNLIMDGDYSGVPAVRSSNYVSGALGSGFLLKPDLLEVGNIAARGIIRTSVFEYNSVSVHSGSDVTVKGGDVLAVDMTAADDAVLTIEGNDTFEIGDILRIKEGTDDEWLEVEGNLVGYWAFDEGSGTVAVDGSGNGNDGTLVNGPTWVDGVVGKCLSFDAAGKRVIIPEIGNDTTPWSVSLWYKRDDAVASSTYRTLLGHRTANIHHIISLQGSHTLAIWDGGDKSFGWTPTNGVQHHIVVVFDTTGTTKYATIYVDGEYKNQITHNLSLATYKFGSIGNWAGGSYYAGPMDEVRIYNRALTADEINILYTFSPNKYIVTRDKGSNYAANNNPAWTKGASVSNYGKSGDGGIYITASDTDAPNLSVFTHGGSPWNDIITHLRLGNLNGYAGYGSDIYGMAAYINANNFIKIDPVNGIRMTGSIVITSGSGIGNLSDAGALATKNAADWQTQVAGAGKPADNATKNIIYRQNEAPTGANGDLWYDTDDPLKPLYRHNGTAWEEIGNYASNTNQLTDGAGLGTTAIWNSITGTGKPADNATKNIISRQATAPASPGVGDIWYNTATTTVSGVPTLSAAKWSGTVWEVIANSYNNTNQLTDGAGLGTTAVWASVTGTGKPADNATKNVIYRQNEAPTGANGDLWYDTDDPLKPLYRHNGTTWEEIGNYASNTSQLTDGAGLGTTAVWASVTGTGKPEDNADVSPALPSDEHLVGYWPFDEGSGTVAVDGSGNGNDGTLPAANWGAGYVGKAGRIDSNFFTAPISVSAPMTLTLWFKVSTNTDESSNAPLWYLRQDDTNYIHFSLYSYGISPPNPRGVPYLQPRGYVTSYFHQAYNFLANQWYFVVFRLNTNQMFQDIYKDGVIVDSRTSPVDAGFASYNFTSLRLYNFGSNCYYTESRLYSAILTASEVKALSLYPAGNKGVADTMKLTGIENGANVTENHTAAAIAGQGALATRNVIGLSDCDITIIEAGKIATGLVIADSIQANSITADKFISTLYGDMNQAMSYVKTVLGAGDEYEHDLTAVDLAAGIHSDIDALTHADYGISIRLSTAKKWDEDGAVWDTGTWDEPTKASGSWTSASMDLGGLKTLQIALRYTRVEENSASTTETIKASYSTDNVNWEAWETMSILNITEAIYKATGSLKSFRYFKIKIELSTTVTTDRIILHTITYLGNVINLFGFEANKAIAAEGTTISLSGFNETPAITVTPVGATALVPLITAQSASSVTVKLFNLSGTAVAGNVNITIIGA